MTQLEAQIILLLAENNLDVSPISRILYMHRNSVMYHIRAIRKKTGKNPQDFYDMCELLPEARFVLNMGADDRTIKALEALGKKVHGGSKDD